LGEDAWYFSQKAGTGQSDVGGHGEQYAVESADGSIVEGFDMVLLDQGEGFLIGRGREDLGIFLGSHGGGHGRKREDSLDPERTCLLQKFVAKGSAARWWLGVADEDNEIALFAGIVPDKQAAPWKVFGDDQSVFDFDLIEIKELVGWKFWEEIKKCKFVKLYSV
jgi:hypothetical protein